MTTMNSNDNLLDAITDAAAAAYRLAETTAKMEQLAATEGGFDLSEWRTLSERMHLMGLAPLVVSLNQAEALLDDALRDKGRKKRVDLSGLEF